MKTAFGDDYRPLSLTERSNDKEKHMCIVTTVLACVIVGMGKMFCTWILRVLQYRFGLCGIFNSLCIIKLGVIRVTVPAISKGGSCMV